MIATTSRPPRIATRRIAAALSIAVVLAVAASVVAVFWVVSERLTDTARVRLDDLTRLVAARVEIQVDAAEPAFLSMANRAAAMLAVDPPAPATLADVRGQLNRFLARTPATGVGIFDADGRLVVEAGSDGAVMTVRRPWRTLSGAGSTLDRERGLPQFSFLEPVTAAGRTFLPIGLSLDDPAIPNPAVAPGGAIVFALPVDRIAGWFEGSLAPAGVIGGVLVNAEQRVVAAFRPDGFPRVPEVGAVLTNLPQQEAVPLDGQVTLMETRAFFAAEGLAGREWLAAVTVVPNRDLRVVLLTRSGSLTALAAEAGGLLWTALFPAAALMLLFVYLVQNEWRKEDRRIDHVTGVAGRLRHATDLLDVGVVDWSVRSGDVVLSAGWRRLLGYDAEEVADEIDEWQARLHPADRDRALAAYQDLADGRRRDLAHTLRLVGRDGMIVAVVERAGVQTDRRGRVTHVVLVQEPERQADSDADDRTTPWPDAVATAGAARVAGADGRG